MLRLGLVIFRLNLVIALLHLMLCGVVPYTVYAEDSIATLDGTEYTGHIVKEDANTVHLEMPNGTIIIPKDIITTIKLEQSWQIENHVDRMKDPVTPLPEASPETLSLDGLTYFPIKAGNRWRYKVRYKPETLYGELLPEKNRDYSIEWRVEQIMAEPIAGINQFQLTSTFAARLSMIEDENDSTAKETMLFIGSLKDDKKNAFLVMHKEIKGNSDPFFLRLLPLQPFIKQNKRWIDQGRENTARFVSNSEVVGIEGIDTAYGFFDNCIVVERIDKIDNQVLTSTTYTWYAPHVGMVKMVQEITFPQDQGGDLTKSFILQEYEIINYGVQYND